MTDPHRQELRQQAERAFQESLERLREAAEKKAKPTPPRVPDPKASSSVPIDPKEWEDAVADIDRYLSSRQIDPSEED